VRFVFLGKSKLGKVSNGREGGGEEDPTYLLHLGTCTGTIFGHSQSPLAYPTPSPQSSSPIPNCLLIAVLCMGMHESRKWSFLVINEGLINYRCNQLLSSTTTMTADAQVCYPYWDCYDALSSLNEANHHLLRLLADKPTSATCDPCRKEGRNESQERIRRDGLTSANLEI
jgi:hypothetical protein